MFAAAASLPLAGSPPRLSMTDRARYEASRRGLAAALGLYFRLGARLLRGGPPEPPPPEALRALERRFDDLLASDLSNVERGLYPRDLLFQMPVGAYLARVPETLVDLPSVVARIRAGRTDDLPADVDLDRYPAYYRRTFHWQTDGWLSRRSARLYDVNVEVLFGGVADVMRRMALPPLVEALRDRPGARVLDVACGTGRFLGQVHRALPGARLYGLDLSPFYVAHAREQLGHVTDLSLVVDDAASMPFADATFDAVTSVFLFHEMPRDARRRVVGEMLRVLRPGGTLVVEDSAQLSESPEIAAFLASFHRLFHEPYYKGYCADDLGTMLAEAGFEVVSSEPHFVAKVVVARRPTTT